MSRPRGTTLLAVVFWVVVLGWAIGVPLSDAARLQASWHAWREGGERPPAPRATSGQTRPLQEQRRL